MILNLPLVDMLLIYMGVEGTLAVGRDSGERIVFIDFVRGIAAMLVAFFHLHIHVICGWPTKPLDPASFTYRFINGQFGLGVFAVAVFFIVSGFLIPATLERKNSTLRDFAVRRFFRLYPLYWVSIAVACAFNVYFYGAFFPWRQVLWNVTMLQGFSGVEDIVGVYWTLQIELVFYVICAALFAFGLLARRRTAVVAALVSAIACAAARFYLDRKLPVAMFLGLTMMSLGNLLRHESLSATGRRDYIAFNLLVAAALVPICWMSYKNSWTMYLFSYWAALACFFGVYLVRGAFEGGTAVTRFSVFLGEISYGAYLFHPLVGAKVLESLYLTGRTGGVVGMMISLAATLAWAYILYRVVEHPSIDLGRRLSKTTKRKLEAGKDETASVAT